MQKKSAEIFERAVVSATETLRSLESLAREIFAAADLITDCLRQGNKLLVCGNGGSAADAADFCTEFACRFEKDRRPDPGMNPSPGGRIISASGQDYAF